MRRLAILLLACAALFAVASSAHAVNPDEVLANPALEERARALSRHLRCMVCQNQSIDDSDAPLARDLRLLVRERLSAGDSDSQVLDFLVARYGEFVLLRPRLTAHTLILWGAPFGVMLIGVIVVVFSLRRRQALVTPKALDADEKRRLDELIS